jgi:hypothetical protein
LADILLFSELKKDNKYGIRNQQNIVEVNKKLGSPVSDVKDLETK